MCVCVCVCVVFHPLFALYPSITTAALEHSRISVQLTCHPCDLISHARSIKPTYDAFITAVAAKTGGDVRFAGLKGMWRIAEKIVLRPPGEQRREPGACKIRDVVRGAIVYTHVGSMYSALDMLAGCDNVLLRKQVCFQERCRRQNRTREWACVLCLSFGVFLRMGIID